MIKVIVSSPSVAVKNRTGSDVPFQINPVFVKDKLLAGEYEVTTRDYIRIIFFLIWFIYNWITFNVVSYTEHLCLDSKIDFLLIGFFNIGSDLYATF